MKKNKKSKMEVLGGAEFFSQKESGELNSIVGMLCIKCVRKSKSVIV